MTTLFELGKAVQARRSEMGLTQGAVATLSGLSRQTISQLESGAIKDLSLQRAGKLASVLGLSLQVGRPYADARTARARMTPLRRAAQAASVSYRDPIAPSKLRKVLINAHATADDSPYVHALLDEAPTSLLASLAEQLQDEAGGTKVVWHNYRKLARQVKSLRDLWQ